MGLVVKEDKVKVEVKVVKEDTEARWLDPSTPVLNMGQDFLYKTLDYATTASPVNFVKRRPKPYNLCTPMSLFTSGLSWKGR